MQKLLRLFSMVVLLAAAFCHLPSQAAHTRKVFLQGFGRPNPVVSLYLNDQIERLANRIWTWEQRLASQGIQATFLLGAGDLRRAILHLPQTGPGDVELFVHLENRRVLPFRLNEVLRFLEQHGVPVRQDIAAIFGSGKHLDLFVKDSYSLHHGVAYLGEFGLFHDMGDTSLNQLTYSPTANRLYGSEANLKALVDRKIVLTELERSQPLEAPVTIRGLEATTNYPDTILRQALRAIRLRLDLEFSPNPNRLNLDAGFAPTLRGFELFFANVPRQQLKDYALDPTYIEQFLKIFRNRSDEELATIERILREKMPETLEIFRKLGLNVEILTRPRGLKPRLSSLEFEAVVRNARYESLDGFLAPDLSVINPFRDIELVTRLVNRVSLKKIAPEAKRPIPSNVLKLFAPKLFHYVANFDGLSLEEKIWTLDSYVSLATFLVKDAWARVVTESRFEHIYFERLAFLDFAELKKGESLMDFVQAQLKGAPPAGRAALVDAEIFSAPAFARLEADLARIQAAGRVPVVFVDLDGTLVDSNSRVRFLLEKYDRTFGTEYFSDFPLELLSHGKIGEDLLYEFLGARIRSFPKLKKTVTAVAEFLKAERFSEEAILADEVNEELAAKVRGWAARGVKVIYLTGRFVGDEAVTRRYLAEKALPISGLILNPGSKHHGSIGKFKVQQMRDFIKANPGSELAGFVENEHYNVEAVTDAGLEVPIYQVLLKHVDARLRMFMAAGPIDLYQVHGKDRSLCEQAFVPGARKPRTSRQ